jgi:hypothetical protein
MTEWLVFAALAVSLVNIVWIIGLTAQVNKIQKVVESLVTQALLTAEVLDIMEQENNGDD